MVWSKVRIGNNTVFGTAGYRTTLTVRNGRLLDLMWRPGQGLLVSGDLYDNQGRRWAVLKKNAWQANTRDARLVATPDGQLSITAADGPAVFEAEVVDQTLTIYRLSLRSRDGTICNLDAEGVLTVTARMQATPTVIVNQLVMRELDQIDLANDFTRSDPSHYRLLDAFGTAPSA